MILRRLLNVFMIVFFAGTSPVVFAAGREVGLGEDGGQRIKGYVYYKPSYENMTGSLMQSNFPSWTYALYPIMGTPMEGYNIVLGEGYCRITDEKLFTKVMGLLRSGIEIGKKIKNGIRKISQKELRDYKEFLGLKDTVIANSVFMSGSEPGWRTMTAANGEFFFETDKVPGREGVIYLEVLALAVPPFDKPTFYEFKDTVLSSFSQGIAEFFPGLDELVRRKSLREYDPEEELLEEKVHTFGERYDREMEELSGLEKLLREAKKKWERPADIEGSWKKRAYKDQLKFERAFKEEHGSSEKWSSELRKEFELGLAAVPDSSRKEWEQDHRKWQEGRQKALAKVHGEIDSSKKNLEKLKEDRYYARKALDDVLDREKEKGFDLVISVDRKDNIEHTFLPGGDFSGETITPEFKTGRDTAVYLIKQYMEEGHGKEDEVTAYFTGTGETRAVLYPEDTKFSKPVLTFKMDRSLERHRIIYDSRPLPSGETRVGAVRTIFDGSQTDVENAIGEIWAVMGQLPVAMLEVEGSPIKGKDREEFNRLWSEANRIKREDEKINRQIIFLSEEFKADNIEAVPASEKRRKLYDERMRLRREWNELYPKFLKINSGITGEGKI